MAEELQLALQHELVPGNAALFARDIVTQSLQQGIQLDYSIESLEFVDSVIESLRANGVTLEQVPEVLFGFGCYLGEVIVRARGGSWRAATTSVVPIVVELEDGRSIDPIGHTFTALATPASLIEFAAAL